MIESLLKYNASSLFLVKPVVGEGLGTLESDYQFISSYLKDEEREDLNGDFLFLLFKPIDFEHFESFVFKQKNNTNFFEDYDYEGGYVVLVYTYPDFMIRDLKKFKEGKFSEFTSYTKGLFNKFYKPSIIGKQQKTPHWLIFDKDKILRKELSELLDVEIGKEEELFKKPGKEEILNIGKIRENEPTTKSNYTTTQ